MSAQNGLTEEVCVVLLVLHPIVFVQRRFLLYFKAKAITKQIVGLEVSPLNDLSDLFHSRWFKWFIFEVNSRTPPNEADGRTYFCFPLSDPYISSSERVLTCSYLGGGTGRRSKPALTCFDSWLTYLVRTKSLNVKSFCDLLWAFLDKFTSYPDPNHPVCWEDYG